MLEVTIGRALQWQRPADLPLRERQDSFPFQSLVLLSTTV